MLDQIVAGLVGALGVIIAQVLAGFTSKRERQLKYLQNCQQSILDILNKQSCSLQTLDPKSYKTTLESSINNTSVDLILQDLTAHYQDTVSTFFKVRHLLPEQIRVDCDNSYLALNKRLFEHGRLDGLETIEASNKKELAVSFQLLNGLVFLGLISEIKALSEKIIK